MHAGLWILDFFAVAVLVLSLIILLFAVVSALDPSTLKMIIVRYQYPLRLTTLFVCCSDFCCCNLSIEGGPSPGQVLFASLISVARHQPVPMIVPLTVTETVHLKKECGINYIYILYSCILEKTQIYSHLRDFCFLSGFFSTRA